MENNGATLKQENDLKCLAKLFGKLFEETAIAF